MTKAEYNTLVKNSSYDNMDEFIKVLRFYGFQMIHYDVVDSATYGYRFFGYLRYRMKHVEMNKFMKMIKMQPQPDEAKYFIENKYDYSDDEPVQLYDAIGPDEFEKIMEDFYDYMDSLRLFDDN